jgi:signal transduction histidine kinase
VNRESSNTGPLATVRYEGSDADGVVRDGAFRARVALSGDNAKPIAVILSADLENLLERVRAIRAADSDLPIWIVNAATTSAPDAKDILAPQTMLNLINEGRVRKWLRRDANAIEAAIRESMHSHEARSAYLKSRRELGTRNRQLHDLQENLEKIVSERTSYLSDAERELHRRTQSTRDLVRFIKELSHSETIEELLLLLNQEIRSFHEVRSPILAVVSPEFGARLHFQQARSTGTSKTTARALEKGWGSKPAKKLWSHRASMRFNDAEDRAYLAQELGRPILARCISIPLGRETGRGLNAGDRTAPARGVAPLLVFEYDFDDAKAERFKRFLIPRLEPLSTALDRIIINREMHAASRLWEATFDGIADPIAVISNAYEVLRMNEAFARFPMKSDRRLCYELFAGRSSPCDGCRLQTVVSTASPREWQVRRSTDVYHVNGYPIRLEKEFAKENDDVRTVIHHYADVTKSLELKGHAFQGEKMAAIGLMAGNIAHELNNPLAGLRSLAQVLAVDPRYPATVKNDMKEIEHAAERSSAIIRDLLEFSKADDRIRERISINEIAERSLNMVKTALHEHRVDIEWADSDSVIVEVDPHLLQHVIFNIVNNACQAMREPGEITLRTRRARGENGQSEIVVIEVADTGPGIPPAIQARVFEPFFTTKEAGQGTGLGLSMSRWIVENSGGTIEVRNQPVGTGTIFTVKLPVAPSNDVLHRPNRTRAIPSKGSP